MRRQEPLSRSQNPHFVPARCPHLPLTYRNAPSVRHWRIPDGILKFTLYKSPLICLFGRGRLEPYRRGAGAVERGGLENRCPFGDPGFESQPLRLFFIEICNNLLDNHL